MAELPFAARDEESLMPTTKIGRKLARGVRAALVGRCT
jgi:hypothetical protein